MEELDAHGRHLFTLAMLTLYREQAIANYAEAEELICRALDLRDAGHAMLERAGQLAYQNALDESVPEPPTPEVVDDIAW
jgi:hypothetical protein